MSLYHYLFVCGSCGQETYWTIQRERQLDEFPSNLNERGVCSPCNYRYVRELTEEEWLDSHGDDEPWPEPQRASDFLVDVMLT